jgi:hypothetical protein
MIFWLEGFEGPVVSGTYTRKGAVVGFIEELKKKGFNPVGIRIEEGDNNVEILLEINEVAKKHFNLPDTATFKEE